MEIGLTTGVTSQQKMLTPPSDPNSISIEKMCCPTIDFIFVFSIIIDTLLTSLFCIPIPKNMFPDAVFVLGKKSMIYYS
jgi:hypothetical protein